MTRWSKAQLKDDGRKRVNVQVRLSADIVKIVDHIGWEMGWFRTQTIERLLRDAIKPYAVQIS